ncbi:hypothetical protein [Krasilnikoviella flava]|uniref:Uncharacterized protein n=1 Tax=Krasilnikoviella flava TaxID=526729 RepID=A0A1T5M0J2_9MICO|nr:hypothetical protein [Krasilnikoviella flava]SKC81737.1 hypothetical protein SAMN04324258_4289 [Krasilnikoviella flava]
MSLLHTALSARRAARRAELEAWPEGAELTPDDVLVDRTSLARLAEHYATPRVYVPVGADVTRVDRFWGDAPVRCVVLARVEDSVPRLAEEARQAWLDADLDRCTALVERARLVGRASQEPPRRFTVHPAPGRGGPAAWLPRDLRRGDVLAIPCTGLVQPSDVQR